MSEFKHFKVGNLVRAVIVGRYGKFIDDLEENEIYRVIEIKERDWDGEQYTYNIINIKTGSVHYTRDEGLKLASDCEYSCCPDGRKEGCPFRKDVY